MLGLSEDILADFQLICGTCSPLPIFDVCGLGNNFPGVGAQCNVEHCAALMVPWYETNYANCLDDLRGFGASDAQLATMIGFYDKCAAIDVEAQEELCEPIFLGDDIGFQNIMEYHDDDGSCTLSIAELATVCAAFYAECLSFLASSEEAVDVPEDCEPVFLGPDIGFANIMEYHDDDGTCSPRRHCHSTLALADIDGHSLGIYTVILLSFSVRMTVPPQADAAVDRAARVVALLV
jgi:hypothetical protein